MYELSMIFVRCLYDFLPRESDLRRYVFITANMYFPMINITNTLHERQPNTESLAI